MLDFELAVELWIKLWAREAYNQGELRLRFS
jgi:hypothetical protein